MTNVFITISIPFGGKSKWASEFLAEHPDTIVICPDEIRKELTGSISDQSQNSNVFSTAFKRLRKAIQAETADIIFDGTNIRGKTRTEIIDCADCLRADQPDCFFHYVVFPCDLEVAMARKKADVIRIINGERSNVPDEIIVKFYNDFQNNIENILTDSRVESVKVIK